MLIIQQDYLLVDWVFFTFTKLYSLLNMKSWVVFKTIFNSIEDETKQQCGSYETELSEFASKSKLVITIFQEIIFTKIKITNTNIHIYTTT